LGIYKAIQYNTVRFSHGGLGYGISAHYRFLPEHKIGVVLLTKSTRGSQCARVSQPRYRIDARRETWHGPAKQNSEIK
jgi:hypothetical protein